MHIYNIIYSGILAELIIGIGYLLIIIFNEKGLRERVIGRMFIFNEFSARPRTEVHF